MFLLRIMYDSISLQVVDECLGESEMVTYSSIKKFVR